MDFTVYVLADAFTKFTITLKLDLFHEIKSTLISYVLSIFLQADIFGVTRSLNDSITLCNDRCCFYIHLRMSFLTGSTCSQNIEHIP
jgi:hypothetical protein